MHGKQAGKMLIALNAHVGQLTVTDQAAAPQSTSQGMLLNTSAESAHHHTLSVCLARALGNNQ
jgi:hypothetical protein